MLLVLVSLAFFTFVEGVSWTVSGTATWANDCDWTGGDIGSVVTAAANCGGSCASNANCDHFTWTSYNGGTCWLKHFGTYTSSNPTAVTTTSGMCGFINTAPTSAPSNTLSITFVNKCPATVLVGAQNVPNFAAQTLAPGASWTLSAPTTWSTGGTVWGCYNNNTKCNTNAPEPPISVIELDAQSGQIWYDVSYVSGYNIPIGLVPNNNCPALTCPTFNYAGVPSELIWSENGKQVGVFSVCKAAYDSVQSAWFKSHWGANYNTWAELVCCSGPYNTKATCDGTAWPTASNGNNYIQVLDSRCVNAYSYPYDDQKALKQCAQGSPNSYQFQFCPSASADTDSSATSSATSSVTLIVFLFLAISRVWNTI